MRAPIRKRRIVSHTGIAIENRNLLSHFIKAVDSTFKQFTAITNPGRMLRKQEAKRKCGLLLKEIKFHHFFYYLIFLYFTHYETTLKIFRSLQKL